MIFEAFLINEYSGNGSEQKKRQRQYDIDSVASIYRLRRGRSFYRIEDCRAVFVTHSIPLVRASRKMFRERELEVTHCITEFTLSNLLWLLQPDSLPNLPRRQIIADAYAATQPDATLWEKYVRKIEKLKNEGDMEAQDYYAFRYTQAARASLMEYTLGSQDVLTDDSVKDILHSVRLKWQAEALNEASIKQSEIQQQADTRTQALSKELEDERRERHVLMEKEQRRASRIRLRSKRIARRTFVAIRSILLFANTAQLLAGAPLLELSAWINDLPTVLKIVFGLVWALLSVFAHAQLADGRSLRNRLDSAELRMAKWLERKLSGLEN